MNKLQRVTISGADDKVNINDLATLSGKYPFVEWAILFSPSRHGEPRYPTMSWISDFGTGYPVCQKALHLCGGYARYLAMGEGEHDWDIQNLLDTIDDFDRVQINLSSQLRKINTKLLAKNIFDSLVFDWIIQLRDDGDESRKFLNDINSAVQNLNPVLNIFPFLDASGGCGVQAQNWKMDLSTKNCRGYAGGINPDNVKSVVETIVTDLPAGERFWIDMESGVRTNDEFDLNRVESVLKICEPFAIDHRNF